MLKQILLSLSVLFIALGMTHIYYQQIAFPGVEISTISASLMIKTMINGLGPKVKLLSSLANRSNDSMIENESLKIFTIPISFDWRDSKMYLKEVGEPVVKYRLRVYQPKEYKKEGYPIILYIHGGGWMYGNIDLSDELCIDVANRGFVVVSVDYRTTPEDIFPSCLNDNLNALSWIGKNYAKYNMNINQLVISGDSAGGHLAIHTQVRVFSVGKEVLEKESVPKVTHQALIYPVTDYYKLGDEKYNTYRKYRDNALIVDGPIMDMFWKYFIGNMTSEQAKSNQYLSVVSAIDASNKEFYSQFPKGFVWIAEYDVLRDEGENFANSVNNAVPGKLTVQEWKQNIHGFLSLNKANHVEYAKQVRALLE